MSATLNSRAKKLAKRLLDKNRAGCSWRKIAAEDYGNQVNFATLNRIALSDGEWLPKDEKTLIVLRLKKPRRDREWKKESSIIEAMSNVTKQALRWKRNKVNKTPS